jgi:hypothetical protein
MNRRALLIQTLLATAFFTVALVFVMDRTASDAIPEALIFGCIYWVASKVIYTMLRKKTTKETDT